MSLAQEWLEGEIILLDEASSTNDIAREYIEQGAPHFTTICTQKQTQGRGRRGKVWNMVPGGSIAMSIILKDNLTSLTPLLVSLAVYRVLNRQLPHADIGIKWPNDILCSEQKICGILVESVGAPKPHYQIVGIGMNVHQGEGVDEKEAAFAWATLESLTGVRLSMEQLIADIRLEIAHLRALPALEMMQMYRSHCLTLGNVVRWLHEGQEITGLARRIDDDGTLYLETHKGLLPVHSGDIIRQGEGVPAA